MVYRLLSSSLGLIDYSAFRPPGSTFAPQARVKLWECNVESKKESLLYLWVYVLLECMALNERGGGRGVNCLKGVFENFLSYNEILCKKPV